MIPRHLTNVIHSVSRTFGVTIDNFLWRANLINRAARNKPIDQFRCRCNARKSQIKANTKLHASKDSNVIADHTNAGIKAAVAVSDFLYSEHSFLIEIQPAALVQHLVVLHPSDFRPVDNSNENTEKFKGGRDKDNCRPKQKLE